MAMRDQGKVEVWMPVMKREDWLKLSPTEKVIHRAKRVIDRIEQAQARYDRGRASGKISEPISFFES